MAITCTYPSIMKKYLLFLLVFGLSTLSHGKDSLKQIFAKSEAFLKSTVNEGKVDYEYILRNPLKIEHLLLLMAEADLSGSSEKVKNAFYINAYNLLVIKTILTNYPVKSPIEIPGFYSQFKYRIAKEELTLNQIEHEKLLRRGSDLRLIFALCRGTTGSLPLASYAFVPHKLNKQLNKKIEACVNDNNFIRMKKNSSRLLICEAFLHWFNVGDKPAFINVLNEFRKDQVPVNYLIDFYPGKQELNILTKTTQSSKLK